MKKSLFLVLTAVCAAPLLAHDIVEKPSWHVWEKWKPLGYANNGEAYVFVALPNKAGNAVTFELLTVLRKPDQRGVDQINEHMLADCQTRQYVNTGRHRFGPKGTIPPQIETTATDPSGRGPVARSGTYLYAAIELACTVVWSDWGEYPEPYKWAKSKFAADSVKP